MLGYVYKYYTEKFRKQKQEMDINKTLYVKLEDGDKTIGELASNARQKQNNQNDKEN